ncbi:hypothetical protein D9758_005797 [Tetrapyrgos nigripes]|uniref:Uncharacterized protein n=1 Tax=Tetrapyrgos nigripes TaxID=182062 RepID=A0A8H5GJK9_9AGAR|nr:hypothetical protein D9758_005797 [Tetrapyrgos nigripes]
MSGKDDTKNSPPKSTEREVTDPITRRPLFIHDSSSAELDQVISGQTDASDKSASSSNKKNRSMEELIRDETRQPWWTDPDDTGSRLRTRFALLAGAAAGVGGSASIVLSSILGGVFGSSRNGSGRLVWTDFLVGSLGCTLIALATAGFVFYNNFLDLAGEEGDKGESQPDVQSEKEPSAEPSQSNPESALWLNSFLSTLWPIVNPILFTSLSDMLEDSLQASLPKFINGVRVADLGQGKEPIRILGMRTLDSFEHGVKSMDSGPKSSDAEGDDNSNEETLGGNYVNLELALAYRTRSSKHDPSSSSDKKENSPRDMKTQAQHMHLLIEFYLSGPGGIVFPVFVEVTGFVGSARLRIQLTPDPPFLNLLTLTFLGQPKVTISVTPLARDFMNMMDVPGLSSFIQESIDSVMNTYVAPRSMTLDLKTMLTGREKVDTEAKGVVIVVVKSAKNFRDGDAIKAWKLWKGEDREKESKGDVYVTVGWGKWGKVLWKTRVIQNEGHPVWEETTVLLVTPAELNAKEKIKLQLWDSDRFTAHDNLGAVEVDLGDIMRSKRNINTLVTRTDPLKGDDGSDWPGTLTWNCGYFEKTGIEELMESLKNSQAKAKPAVQSGDAPEQVQEVEERDKQGQGQHNTNPIEELKQGLEKVAQEVGEKTGDSHSRETVKHTEKEKEKEAIDDMIAGSPPAKEWPAGILSVRVMQIAGVEVQNTKNRTSTKEDEGASGGGGDAPSPYCTIVINHQRVYKTRTKMKESNPYYDAGTERFIPSWLSSIVMIAVRDFRQHEQHPLIGVVILPIHSLFTSRGRSQITDTFPLQGGIGCGRMRVSLVFRSLKISIPGPRARIPLADAGEGKTGRECNLGLGWESGTLEIYPETISFQPEGAGNDFHLESSKIIFKTLFGKGKVLPNSNDECQSQTWNSRRGKPIRLPVLRKFSSCVLIQFRKRVHVLEYKVLAFATVWLRDIPDTEEVDAVVEVWENLDDAMEWARFNYNSIGQGMAQVFGEDGNAGEGRENGKQKPSPKKLGTLHMKMRFWPGLSGYHRKAGNHDKGLADVMEMLDCMESSREEIQADLGIRFDEEEDDDDSSSSSSSSSSDESEGEDEGNGETGRVGANVGGLKDEVKGYRSRKKELHRNHRGLMQWGFARKLAWMGHEAEDKSQEVKEKIVGRMKHGNKYGLDGGMEKEA